MKTFTPAAPRPRRLALALALGLGVALSAPLAAQQANAAQPWMDTALSPDQRAALLLTQMTEDEKFQMLRSYFGLGTDKIPKPEGALGSAGYVPGIARLGIPAQQLADAGVGVTNPGGIRKGDFATAMPSGPSTASSLESATGLCRRQDHGPRILAAGLQRAAGRQRQPAARPTQRP